MRNGGGGRPLNSVVSRQGGDVPIDSKPLEYFKDWSNYLLITTVGAVGWVASATTKPGPAWIYQACLVSFALSIVFGIFTLALVPLVAEQRRAEPSFYDVRPKFHIFWIPGRLRIKWACLPQHICFVAGVLLYVVSRW